MSLNQCGSHIIHGVPNPLALQRKLSGISHWIENHWDHTFMLLNSCTKIEIVCHRILSFVFVLAKPLMRML